MKQSSCTFSKSMRYWTIFWSLITMLGIAYLSYTIYIASETNYILIIVLMLLLCSFVSAICLSPYGVEVSSDAIKVKLISFALTIPTEEVARVEKIRSEAHGIRLLGIGHVFGDIGWFRNDELGKYLCFTKDNFRFYR